MSSSYHLDRQYSRIGIIAVLVVAGLLFFRFINLKITERNTTIQNNIILEKLRSTAKLVIWEQDFKIVNITRMEKKYFNSDFLKFTEKVSTTARGRIGFHIDLGDTANTTYRVEKDRIEIHAPLQITYVSIDNSTIEQIKEASFDPTLEVDKEEIVRRLGEIALRQQLKPALEEVKKLSLSKQEKSLTALTGKPVKIILTSVPSLQSGLEQIKMK
ncbi:MAG TPA: DUF4230 domain-containing protein [Bacteroidales bacterium]|nr:DUF4230 domain-containing protein [Bacteroidales bacterium]HPT01854.1 DUF4230 domain-containing protein [Bacteroidales bacterium]